MAGNRGQTSLKSKRRSTNPMQEFDRLPADLRAWVALADLPWRAKSVKQAFDRAVTRTGDTRLALMELDALQARLIAKDARAVWGQSHPSAHDKQV